MEAVLEKLRSLETKVIDPNLLQTTLSSIDFSTIDYKQFLNEADFDKYHRVVVMESPIRVFLTVSPPEFQVSTHMHNNFWGYCVVLKGLLTETFFVYDSDTAVLSCHPPKNYRKGEMVFEPMNVIHHIQNPSPSKPLVTAHFYYPTVYDYNGVMIFDIKNRRIAELNERAPGVSWNHPAEYYNRIEENAFSVVNLW